MGWACCGFNTTIKKYMGYGYHGICAKDGCNNEIDHGLSYVCGGMHLGGSYGCGDYFCSEHLINTADINEEPVQLCRLCYQEFVKEGLEFKEDGK